MSHLPPSYGLCYKMIWDIEITSPSKHYMSKYYEPVEEAGLLPNYNR